MFAVLWEEFLQLPIEKEMSLHYSMLSSRTSCGMEISISLLSSMIATDSMCAQIGKYNFFLTSLNRLLFYLK